MKVQTYESLDFFDEMFAQDGRPRTCGERFVERIELLADGDLQRRQKAAELSLQNLGVTFTVYGHEAGMEKVWPFDLLPRIIDADEWSVVERGLEQRIRALNLFVADVYNTGNIFNDRVLPEDLVFSSKTLRKQCRGYQPPQGVWCHITGVDLIRDVDGQIYVLEDNLRCPSGVSYVLENRELMKGTFAHVFQGMSVAAIEDYPEQLLKTLLDCAPEHVHDPNAVVLTPGIYNSAYFEHTFLAQQMGVELVQGSDLVVENNHVYMSTTHGLSESTSFTVVSTTTFSIQSVSGPTLAWASII